MSYFEYAKNWKHANHFTQGRKDEIRDYLLKFDEYENIIAKLIQTQMLSKPILTDMLNLDGDDMRRLWKYLVGESLIIRRARGYRRTPAFTTLLKKLQADEEDARVDLGDDFETGGDFEGSMGDGYFGANPIGTDPDVEDPPF